MTKQEAREAIAAGRAAEAKLGSIARTRRPTDEETQEAREAYRLAAEGSRILSTACDMTDECDEPVTHVDTKGYIYCARHAAMRCSGTSGRRCRKLRAGELKTR
jgi:hypothetical protein